MNNEILEYENIKYLCFEGGGALGASYIGALCALQDIDAKRGNILFPGLNEEIVDNPMNDAKLQEEEGKGSIEGVSGSSVGAIIALCVAMGYTAEEINTRIITDKAFSILGREDYMTNITRYYKPKNCKPKKKSKNNAKSETTWQEIKSTLGDIFVESKTSKEIQKWLSDFKRLPGLLIESMLGNYVLCSFENPEFFERCLYRIIGEALFEHRTIIFGLLWLFERMDRLSETNLMPFWGMVNDGENFPNKLAFYRDWINNKRWENITNPPSREEVQNFTLIALGFLIGIILIVILMIRWISPKKEIISVEFKYRLGMFIRVLTIALNNVKNNQGRSLILVLEMIKNSKTLDLAVLFGRLQQAAIRWENGNFWWNMEQLANSIYEAVTEPTFSRILNSIVSRGGLYPGETVDIILAELIYSKVEVIGKGSAATFKKRDIPYDFTDSKSRAKHPLFNEIKLLRKSKNISHNDIDDVYSYTNELNDYIFEQYDEYISTLSKQKRKNIRKKDKKDIRKYWEDIKVIKNHFTFEDFVEIFKVNLVVTGSNILQGKPVYFNSSLTPSFPVVKAVGISSCFPIVFRPILLQCYTENVKCTGNYSDEGDSDNWKKTNEEWYQANYNGWFIDGGLLNNYPINAFNYAHESLQANNFHYKSMSPVNMVNLPANPNILSIRLGGIDENNNSTEKKVYDDFIKDADQYKSPSLLKLNSLILESNLNHATNTRILNEYEKQKQVIALQTGNISVLDMTANEKALIDVDYKSYKKIFERFPTKLDSISPGMEIDQSKVFEATIRNQLSERLNRGKKKSKRWRRSHSRLLRRPVSRDRKYQKKEIK